MARNKCISSFRVESGDSRILNKFDERETFVAKLPANLNAENFAIPNGSTERIMFRITLNQETDLALLSTSRILLASSIKYLLYVKNSDVWYSTKIYTYYATISSIVQCFSLYRSLYVCWQFDDRLLTLCYLWCIEYRYDVRAQAHTEQKEIVNVRRRCWEIIKNSSRHCVCRALNIPRDILNVNTFNNILN